MHTSSFRLVQRPGGDGREQEDVRATKIGSAQGLQGRDRRRAAGSRFDDPGTRRVKKELAESNTSVEFAENPRISDYYTAQVTLTVTFTKAEAEALRLFLTRTPPRESALGFAWGVVADALDDKGI